MKIFLALLMLSFATSLQGQGFYSQDYERNYVSFGVGLSGYYGDLQHQLLVPNPAFSFEFSHRLSNYLKIRESLTIYEINAEDKEQNDPELIKRNLSFRSQNIELALILEVRFFKSHARGKLNFLNPYLFFGAGITTVNPTTRIADEKYKLRKYQTEGVKYSGLSKVLPVGVGLEMAFSKRLSLIGELGFRFTGSDYLDDVSTEYTDIDPTEEVRFMLADRSTELGLARKSPGQQRGGTGNDVYTVLMFKLQFLLHRDFWRDHRWTRLNQNAVKSKTFKR